MFMVIDTPSLPIPWKKRTAPLNPKPKQGGGDALTGSLPALRTLRASCPAAGRGWMGVRERNALQITAITRTPLLPAWLALVLAGACLIAGWLREGRR
ncbi:MAG: hypothetical protein GDA40_12130 [Rhodobacteraceae bacterium]|nr:hypothetical protein [Paracoccaceae bacterium]